MRAGDAGAAAGDREDRGGRHGLRPAPRRRHPHPRARPRASQRWAGQGGQAGARLGLRARPAALGGTGPAGRRLPLLAGQEGRAPATPSREQRRHASQADAYSGFRGLYEPGADGASQFREAACWAHLRRDFHDVGTATQSAIARDALDRIGALYDIERQIAGRGAAERLAARAAHSAPKVEAFRSWSEAQLARLPGKGELAKAFRYALKRWPSFTLFLEDGRVAIDNSEPLFAIGSRTMASAERAMRPIGVGRRNWLVAGSDTGGETLARAMTLIETAKMNRLDPQAYLADLLDRIHDHQARRLDELLPWNWAPMPPVTQERAA